MNKTSGSGLESFFYYLPYSEEDEKLGMYCTGAGRTEILPHVVYPPNKNEHPAPFRSVAEGRVLPDFQILYVSEFEIEFHDFIIAIFDEGADAIE
jgi:hypothetical protein